MQLITFALMLKDNSSSSIRDTGIISVTPYAIALVLEQIVHIIV